MSGLPAAPTFSECVEALHSELLRARELVGSRWASPNATPSLSGRERYELGALLDALHNVPAYLTGLASGEPDLILGNVVEWALGDAAASHSRVGARMHDTTPVSRDPAARPSLAELDFDDGPFGPAHET